MLRACFALAAAAGLLSPATAAPVPKVDPDPKSLEVPTAVIAKARELVKKLGSDAFADREEAERELAEMGRFARPVLIHAVNRDPDPEVRARCSTLLPKATAEEMKARLASFLADAGGKYEHDHPGWHRLRATVRGEWTAFGWTFTARPDAGKAARELFIEFMQARGGRSLLAALDGPPDVLGRAVAVAKHDLYNSRLVRTPGQARRVPSLAEVAAVVFAESQVQSRFVPLVPRGAALNSVITTSGLIAAVRGSDERALALHAVVDAWFDSRTAPADLYSALTLAKQMQNAGAECRIAARILGTPGVPGYQKGMALNALVHNKAADRLSALEKSFADATALSTSVRVVNNVQVRHTIEVRDAALAAALVLTGQEPTDYGFDAHPRQLGNTNFTYTWARILPDGRKAAFEKWKAWREKHP